MVSMGSIMSDSNRPLAPAPIKASSANDSHLRRKNVGTACLACKARKLKCTGASPCANCVKSHIECTLNQGADKRRRGAVKRKIDHLEDKEDLLIRLVGILRESGNRRTIPLLNLIRSNASLSEIRYYVDHQMPRVDLAGTPELVEVCHEVQQLQQSESRSMRRILDAKRLSDMPRFTVPASPWTTVVSDHDFVSHLVSLWFTWCHPYCNWVDRDRFVRDMQRGFLESSFCSPFLVNIILADACAYSDYPEAYAIPDDLSSKGTHFYDEAKRLLNKEEGRINLPTVQGLGVLWSCASMTGRDRQGWIYRGQLAYSAQELVQNYSVLASKADEETLRMACVVNNTIWGLFNIATMHALHEKKMPPIRPPQRQSLPPVNHDSVQDIWQPYPSNGEGIQSHTTCLFGALCTLNLITYDLCRLLYQGRPDLLASVEMNEKAENLHERLRQWADRLPACLRGSNIEVPHVLCVHMYYHAIIITAYETLTPTHPATPPTETTSDISIHAETLCLSAARSIAQLMRIHRNSWGVDRMPVRNIHWITAALFILLERLDDPTNRDSFITLSIAAKAFSRRYDSSKTILRTIQATARDKKIVLPTETDPLFAELETHPAQVRVKDEPTTDPASSDV